MPLSLALRQLYVQAFAARAAGRAEIQVGADESAEAWRRYCELAGSCNFPPSEFKLAGVQVQCRAPRCLRVYTNNEVQV